MRGREREKERGKSEGLEGEREREEEVVVVALEGVKIKRVSDKVVSCRIFVLASGICLNGVFRGNSVMRSVLCRVFWSL